MEVSGDTRTEGGRDMGKGQQWTQGVGHTSHQSGDVGHNPTRKTPGNPGLGVMPPKEQGARVFLYQFLQVTE